MGEGDEKSWNDMFSYSLNCEASAIEEINFTGDIGKMRRARRPDTVIKQNG